MAKHAQHDVFPLDLSLIADIGLHLLELRHHVAVVRLIHQSRQELVATGQQLLSQERCRFRQRGIETFQNVGVRFERQIDKLLQFPIGFLRFMALQLFGGPVQGPMQIGWRQIDPTPTAPRG